MKNLRFLNTLLLFITCASLTFWSCQKEKVDYPLHSLDLKVENAGNGLRLTWSKVEATDFIEYVVVRATTDTVPDLNFLQSTQSVIVTRITNLQQNTFIDPSQFGNQVRLFYRVFARLEKRTLASLNHVANDDLIDLTITGFSSNLSEVVKDESKGYPRLFISGFSNTIALYDDKSERISSFSVPSIPSTRMTLVSDKNGGSSLVVWANFNSTISFLNTASLAILRTVNMGGSVVGACGTTDGFVMVLTSNGLLQTYDMSGSALISSTSLGSSFLSSTAHLVRHPTERKIYVRYLLSSGTYISEVKYSENGTLSPHQILGVSPNISFSTNQNFEISPAGNVLTFGNLAFSLSMQELGRFVSNESQNDMEFNKDGSKLYVARNVINSTTFTTTAMIDEYATSNFKLTNIKPAKISCQRLFIINDQVYILGTGSSGRLLMQKTKF
jgi:hypothetical protein